MIDIEKVKKGLECCSNTGKGRCESSECPYWIDSICCIDEMQNDAISLLKEQQQQIWELEDQVEYLTDKQKKKFLVNSDGKITPLPDVVRCKDCIHRWKSEKCVLAAISEEKNLPLFMLDNRGEWFCADGKRS